MNISAQHSHGYLWRLDRNFHRKLFIAGVIPGILLAAGFCGMIVVRCFMDPNLGPAGPKYSWTERLTTLTKLMPTTVIFLFSIMFLLLDAVLDTFGMLILTLPLVFPICRNLGFDPVWFGI